MKLLENLIRQNYYISKYLHTSYLDLDEITYVERSMLFKLISQDKEEDEDNPTEPLQ